MESWRWNKISNSFNCSYPGSDLFRQFIDVRLPPYISSVNIPSDFTEVTFSVGTISIESWGLLDKVLNFCLDPISVNSVLAVFKVSLLEIRPFV